MYCRFDFGVGRREMLPHLVPRWVATAFYKATLYKAGSEATAQCFNFNFNLNWSFFISFGDVVFFFCCCNQQQAHFKTMPVFSREITWKKTPKPNSPHHNAAKIKWQNHKAHNYKKKYVWHCVLNSIWPVLTVYVLRERAGVTVIRRCDWEFRRVLMFENQRK